jgi:hypothetical protein
MACEPTSDLDDQGAAGDRLGAPADGGRGMDSLASGANQPAAPGADEIERIVQSRHDKPYRVLGPQPEAGSEPPCARSSRTPDTSSCTCSENGPPSTKCIERTRKGSTRRRFLGRPTASITNTSYKRKGARRTGARIRIASAASVSAARTNGCSCAASICGCSKSSARGRQCWRASAMNRAPRRKSLLFV